MEQTRYANLPIIGRVQHGEQRVSEKGHKRVVELGHFIAKIQDSFMESYLKKFNEQYKGQKSIDIEFFDENPLTTKLVRYNQSGEVCSRHLTANMARQKEKNGWKEIECSESCQHRQRNEQGKRACNRIGWLKFIIPSICRDRIWLMRITGQKSIDRLEDYIALQKNQGNSIKGKYTLFLKQEEDLNCFGQSFTNYVLDIFQKDNSIQAIPQTTTQTNSKPTEQSPTNANIVDNNIQNTKKQEAKTNTIIQMPTENKQEDKQENKQNITEKAKTTKETVTQKKTTTTKSKAKNTITPQIVTEPNFDNCYVLIGNRTEKFLKDGQPKEYFIGEFHDMTDKPIDIIINPEFTDYLSTCGLGTVVELDIKEFGDKKIAMDLKYVQIIEKNIAA